MRRIFCSFLIVGAGCLLAACAGERYHREGLNLLAAGKTEEGLRSLERAVAEEPGNVTFKSDLLNSRSTQFDHMLASADSQRTAGQLEAAETAYGSILKIDPKNVRAAEGLEAISRERRYGPVLASARDAFKRGDVERAHANVKSVLLENPGNPEAISLRRQIEDELAKARIADPQLLTGHKKPINLEFRDANLRLVLDALARTTGINFILDKDVNPDLRTTVYLRQSSLEDAIDLILQTNRLEKKVLNRNAILIYANTPEKLKEYQELVVKGFYLSNADVKQTQAMLTRLLKAKDTFIDEKLNLLVMRDTPDAIKLAEKLIAMHDLYEPELMLEVEVLEVKRSRLTELGVKLPNQLTLTPLTAGPTATLSDLRGLNSDRIGTSLPSATVNFRREIGDAKILANPRIRARNREKAKIMIGDKIPAVSITTTANGVSSESVQYLDVGIKLDVESNVYLQDEVAIKIGLEVSSLVREVRTPAGSLAYQIGSRSASTVLRLKDGETQVLAGLINDEDRTTASRVPGIGDIPMLGRLFASQKDDHEKTEIVLSITPRLIRNINRPDAANSEFWSGTESSLRIKPFTTDATRFADSDDKALTKLDAGQGKQDQAGATAPTALSVSWQGPSEAKVGDTFKLALRLKANGGVRSFPLQMAFDSKVFQIVDIAEGAYFKQGGSTTSLSSNVDPAVGKAFVSVVRSGTEGASGEDTVAVFTLRALAAAQKSDIRLLMTAPVSVGGAALVPPLPAPFLIDVNK
jgi:general secretion pathway protein D